MYIIMERIAMQELISWKNRPGRKPLIVRGARQVGNTWLIKARNFVDAPSGAGTFYYRQQLERMDRNQLSAALYHVWIRIPGGHQKDFCG